MTPDRISSTGRIVLKSESQSTNSTTGNNTSRVYSGSFAQCAAQRVLENNLGATITSIESTGDGNYQLTAGYPFDIATGVSGSAPANNHELETTMEQVDVLVSDVLRENFFNEFGGYPGMTGGMAFLRRLIGQWEASHQDVLSVDEAEHLIDTTYATFTSKINLLKNYFRGICIHGVKNCNQFNTVYRRRITAASPNQVKASFEGAGKIWTTGEVTSFEATPAAWWFQLPANFVWFKTPPTVNTVAGQKTEISYHYIAAPFAWSGTFKAYATAPLITY